MLATKTTLILSALFLLSSCKQDCGTIQRSDAVEFEKQFTFCMDKAASVKTDGSHDNRYDLVSGCENYAARQVERECWAKEKQ